jgi:hypothetical protein
MKPIDKAMLFQQNDVVDYLKGLESEKNSEKLEMWRNKQILERFPYTVWVLDYFKYI